MENEQTRPPISKTPRMQEVEGRFGGKPIDQLLAELCKEQPLFKVRALLRVGYPTLKNWVDLFGTQTRPLPPGLEKVRTDPMIRARRMAGITNSWSEDKKAQRVAKTQTPAIKAARAEGIANSWKGDDQRKAALIERSRIAAQKMKNQV